MSKRRFILLFSFFILAHFCFGQTKVIDSLKLNIEHTVGNSEKLSLIFELSQQSISPDSLLPFVLMAEKIAATSKNKQDADMATYCRASYYARKNITDSALIVIDKLVTDYKDNKKQQPLYLKFLFTKARILDRSNQYTQAISQLVEVLETAEILKDTLTQIQAKTGIGWVQMEMGQYKEALEWLHKAVHTSANQKFYKNYGALYSNLASAHNSLGNLDSAGYYISIAINDARENDNLTFLATALSMQAKIFIDGKQPHLAEVPLKEVVEIRKKMDDPFYIVYDMSNLASYYAGNNQPEKGITLCKEGIAIAKQKGLASQLLMIYQALAENYKAAGKTAEYGETLENVLALKDSFNSINSSKLIAEMQAGNEVQKNEKQILEQKLNLTRKNYWLYGSALFAVMAAIIAWLGFKNYRRKQKIKMQLALEEEKRSSEQAVIDAEEHERKRIAADLHDNLGAYAASIVSNLDHIQLKQTDAPSITALQELRSNSQSMVSQLSDTIWVLKKDALFLTAISDRLKVFIQRVQPSYPDVTIDVLEKIKTDHLLPPSQAFHLFQITREAIINALKHSGGKQVTVTIEADQRWKISINDNGNGMTNNPGNSGGGNGLQNMKNRAKEGGWDIEWQQNEQGGTSVRIAPTTN